MKLSLRHRLERWRGGWLALLVGLALVVGLGLVAAAALAIWRLQRQSTLALAAGQHCALPLQDAAAPHPGMVWVPAGILSLGDTVYREEAPLRETPVAGFWMDRTEVTNDEFAAFVQATGHVTVAERAVDAARHPDLPADMRQPGAVVFVMPTDLTGGGRLTSLTQISRWWRYTPGANWRHPGGPATDLRGRGAFPVVTVALADAQAYARWKGHTLPSEAQWEWAARAARRGPAPQHAQPTQANTWQGLFPVANSADDGFVGLAPVGCYAPNHQGLFDLIGNVWELTADAWTPSHATPLDAPPDQLPSDPRGLRGATAGQRVIKGGSFLCAPNYCMRYRAGARQPQDDDLGASHLGFRTVLAAPGP